MKTTILLFSLVKTIFTAGTNAPFHLCNINQNDFENCFENAVRQLVETIPEYNLPSLEPYYLPEAIIPPTTNILRVNHTYYPFIMLSGLTNLTVSRFHINFDEKNLHVELFHPQLKADMPFCKIEGTIWDTPVNGTSPCREYYVNLSVNINAEFTIKNDKYIELVEIKCTLDPENVEVWFEDLFYGDQTENEKLNQRLQDEWRDVFEDFKTSDEAMYGGIFTEIFNKFFSEIPVDNVFKI